MQQRAQSILQNALAMERKNEQQLVGGVVAEVFRELESIKETVPRDVYMASFEAALEGIEKNYCDYSKDIVLERIRKSLSEKVKEVQSLTPEQILRIVSLNEQQLKSLKQMDD